MAGEIILVVEDNDIMRRGIQLLLEADGFKVMSAIHGLEALEQMRSTRPDLILSDISMPVMDGYAFFEAARAYEDWVAIPFIFLTARGGREDIFEGRKLGAEDYLVKPVNRHELITAIRSRLERSQELMLMQLKQAYQASLILLANAIELRDQATRDHVGRVMDYATAIGRKIGLNNSQLEALQYGSILHDIGKIDIPESILKKPASLSDREWDEMKRHPLIGAELIENIPFLVQAIPVIRHHHERWDGLGYPDGLAGEEIPIEARIVAVADALDAMTTVRIYHGARTPEQAHEEILRCSGNRYDPQVVEALKGVWKEIKLFMV